MSQQKSGLPTTYDLRNLDGVELDHQPTLDILMRNNGMNLQVHDNKNDGKFYVSTATQTAIEELNRKFQEKDENQLLMNLTVIGHYALLDELDPKIQSFTEKVSAFPYNVKQEDMPVDIQGDKGKLVWFTPYKNSMSFAKRIAENVTGVQKMFLRMFLTRGIIETRDIKGKVNEAVEKEYEALRHGLEDYMTDKKQEYQGKRIIDELGLDPDKLYEIDSLEQAEQLKEAKSV